MERRLFLLLFLCAHSRAEIPFDALRAKVMELRAKPRSGPRGATEPMTAAKHLLRDWVETRLTELAPRGDQTFLERKLNAELRDAGLICEDPGRHPSCPKSDQFPDWSEVGSLGNIRFHWSRHFLVLITGVGIECGQDQSAYLYTHSKEGWRRVWQNEQNVYSEKQYKPQSIAAVLVSDYSKVNDYLVLTLGTQPWCSSAWHEVYYRAFRLGPDPNAPPLVDGAEWAYLGSSRPIQGSVGRNEILVEFAVRSKDSAVHNRPAIRHYKIDADGATRIHPLALSPRDFVDEWISQEWRKAVYWSEPVNRASLRDAHQNVQKLSGEFIYPTMRCAATPNLWQVGLEPYNQSETAPQPKNAYFLVRWRPPFQFSMVEVRDRPWEGCTEEDPDADEVRTLFPDVDWR